MPRPADQPKSPVFMSVEPRPVKVDYEMNIEPLYFTDGNTPVSLLLLDDSFSEICNTLSGMAIVLENIPPNFDISPEVTMLNLALKRMQTVMSDLIPSRARSGQRLMYDRSTNPPSRIPSDKYFERIKARNKARQDKLALAGKDTAHA